MVPRQIVKVTDLFFAILVVQEADRGRIISIKESRYKKGQDLRGSEWVWRLVQGLHVWRPSFPTSPSAPQSPSLHHSSSYKHCENEPADFELCLGSQGEWVDINAWDWIIFLILWLGIRYLLETIASPLETKNSQPSPLAELTVKQPAWNQRRTAIDDTQSSATKEP